MKRFCAFETQSWIHYHNIVRRTQSIDSRPYIFFTINNRTKKHTLFWKLEQLLIMRVISTINLALEISFLRSIHNNKHSPFLKNVIFKYKIKNWFRDYFRNQGLTSSTRFYKLCLKSFIDKGLSYWKSGRFDLRQQLRRHKWLIANTKSAFNFVPQWIQK